MPRWPQFVAARWRGPGVLPKMPSIEQRHNTEQTMKISFKQRLSAWLMSLAVTAVLMGGIDHLAGNEPASALWAEAVATSKASAARG
jgi:hypothetical protein